MIGFSADHMDTAFGFIVSALGIALLVCSIVSISKENEK